MPSIDKNLNKKHTKTNKILVWTIAIVIILAAIFFLVPLAQSLLLRASLKLESDQALVENQSRIQNEADEYIKTTARKIGTDSQAVYSATYNSCYIDHSDRGWIANNYNYNCLINIFAFFEVNNGSDLLKTIDQYAKPASMNYQSSNSDYFGEIFILDTLSDTTLSDTEDLPYVFDIVKSDTYTDVRDVLDIRYVNRSNGVVAYASDEAFANRSLLNQSGDQKLNSEKTYLILRSSDQYFHKNIGCKQPTIIFCNSPI